MRSIKMKTNWLIIIGTFISLIVMCIGVELNKTSISLLGGIPLVFLLIFGLSYIMARNTDE